MELFPPSILEPLSLREIFSTDRLIEVDLGSGPGKFLVESALKFPERNFLGIERLLGRVQVGGIYLASGPTRSPVVRASCFEERMRRHRSRASTDASHQEPEVS